MTPGPQYAGVDTNGRKLWHAYTTPTEMLRDKAGVGRQFYSPEAAQRALDDTNIQACNHDPVHGYTMTTCRKCGKRLTVDEALRAEGRSIENKLD